MNKADKNFVLLSFDPAITDIDEVVEAAHNAEEAFPEHVIVIFPKGIDIEGFFTKEDALNYLEDIIKQIKKL